MILKVDRVLASLKKIEIVLIIIFFILLIGLVVYAVPSFSQYPSSDIGDVRPSDIKQEGQLISVRITRGDPIRIFVFGREEAKIEPSDLQIVIRRLQPYPGKILSFNKLGDAFVARDEEPDSETEFEVTAKIKEKKEVLNLKYNTKTKELRK